HCCVMFPRCHRSRYTCPSITSLYTDNRNLPSLPTRRSSDLGLSGSVESPESANETLLNATLRARPDVPFACAGGVCGTCRAKLGEGEVEMAENFALEKDEIDAGYILTCQSRPKTSTIKVDCDAWLSSHRQRISMIDLHLDAANPIAEAVRNNPKAMNALGPEDLQELSEAYAEAEKAGVRALLLRGEGRGCSAGRNIKGLDPRDDDATDYLANKVTPVL